MPVVVKNHADLKLTVIRFSGIITLKSLQGLLQGATSEPVARDGFDFLILVSKETEFKLDFADVQGFVDLQNKRLTTRSGSAKTALYAPGDLGFGFARMYESISAEISARPISVFRNKSDALDYLSRADADWVFD